MRIRISKGSGVPVADQISNQIVLAIASGESAPGTRLPSIRALATRLDVHPNTIRAAYLDLERREWVATRQGSGVYVMRPPEPDQTLQRQARTFVDQARAFGLNDEAIRVEVERALARVRPERVLVLETEPELAAIIAAEIAEETGLPVVAEPVGTDLARYPRVLTVCLRAHAAAVAPKLDPGVPLLLLSTVSIEKELQGKQRPPEDNLIALVTSSHEVVRFLTSVLVGAGIDPEALIHRDPGQPDWNRGLSTTAFVIADILSAQKVPPRVPVRLLRVISEASMQEIRIRWNDLQSDESSSGVPGGGSAVGGKA